jgi:prolyl 4-hydroxylase
MQPAQSPLDQVFALFNADRVSEGLSLIEQIADRGDAEALFTLADMHWRGVHVPANHPRARDYFRRASDAGHGIATRAYTNLLASGLAGGQADWPAAMQRLRHEAQTDSRRALMLSLIERMNLTETGDPRQVPQGRPVLDSPEVTGFPRLFSRDECDFLILVAEPSYEESLVLDDANEVRDAAIRTSDGATMHWLIEDPVIHALNRRIAAATGTGYDQGEPLLILRYRPGQEYRRHFDALPGMANQRFKTALVYLNEEYEGGETAFPKAERKIRGSKGDCIVFRNVLPDGSLRPDPMSEHAGLPVTRGTKYLASRWIRYERHLEW